MLSPGPSCSDVTDLSSLFMLVVSSGMNIGGLEGIYLHV